MPTEVEVLPETKSLPDIELLPGFADFAAEPDEAKQEPRREVRFASRPTPKRLIMPSLDEVKHSSQTRADNLLAGRVTETVNHALAKGDLTLGVEAAHEAVRLQKYTANIWRGGVEPMPFEDFVPQTTTETKGGKTTRLSPRQLKVFNDCGLNEAYGWIDPARRLNEIILLYGKGCLAGDSLLTDQESGETLTAKQWANLGKPLNVLTWHGEHVFTTKASPVYQRGYAPIYRVTLDDGRVFRVTSKHRCLTRLGWSEVGSLAPGDRVLTQSLMPNAQIYSTSITFFTSITSVEQQGEEAFYDLTVPVTACYFDAQGVLHHNSGKDWLSAKANAYLGYLMCLLRLEPATYYREYCGLELEAGTTLSSLNVAPSAEVALQTYFAYLRKNLSAPIFHEFEPRILTESIEFCMPSERDLAKKQGRRPEPFFQLLSKHSKSSGLDGYNLVFWVMDEADAFYDKAEKSNAEEVHGILRSSCNTRMGTYWTGMVISYPRVKDGFMLRTYERAKANMLAHGMQAGYYADVAATWDVRPSVSRQDPNIAEDYEHDPAEAAARYECIPLETIDAFIEMPEKIDAAVEHNAEPVAYVTIEDYQTQRTNGHTDYYIRARIADIRPTPGYEYFLGGDAGHKRDAYALSVWHTDNQADGFSWICPRCASAAPTLLNGARYEKQDLRAREAIKPGGYIICGCCFTTSAAYNSSFSAGSVSVAGWWKKATDDQSAIHDSLGRAYNVGHIHEDLLVQIKPVRKGNVSQVNRSVFFPAVQTMCRELIEKLPVAVARFDPYQTAEITMGLRESTGGDIDEISFSSSEQYKRAKLAKMMLYAGLLHFLPYEGRDREWKRLQRANGNKIDHPAGLAESKDLYDAEAICIWLAVNRKVGSLELLF